MSYASAIAVLYYGKAVPGGDPSRARPLRVAYGSGEGKVSWHCRLIRCSGRSGSPRTIRSGPSTRRTAVPGSVAEKGDRDNCYVGGGLTLKELLDRLEQIEASQQ